MTILEFKNRLSQIIPINEQDIDKLYDEILSFFSESQEKFIIRRHKELQKSGFKNKHIYSLILKEMAERLFIGKKLSERQIKRVIYKEK